MATNCVSVHRIYIALEPSLDGKEPTAFKAVFLSSALVHQITIDTPNIYQNENYYLSKPKDKVKDQTYFLCQVNPAIFQKLIFPLENLTKKEVRQIAADNAIELFAQRRQL